MAASSKQHEAKDAAPAGTVPPRKVLPLRALLHRTLHDPLTRGVILALAGSSLSVIGLLIFMNHPDADRQQPAAAPINLQLALAALDEGSTNRATKMARAMIDDPALDPAAGGGPAFILGVVTADDADRLWGDDQRRYFKIAARYLGDSQTLDFPEGYESKGLFLLGKSMLYSGQTEQSRAVLTKALDSEPYSEHEIHRLLSIAFQSEPNADLHAALKHNTAYLASEHENFNRRQDALLVRAQILYKLGRNDESEEVLAQISPSTESGVEALIVQGELLMSEGLQLRGNDKLSDEERKNQADAKYTAAIEVLRKAQNRGTQRDRITRRSMYLIGRCYLAMDDSRAAIAQFQRTREIYPDSDEGVAAGIDEAELVKQIGLTRPVLDIYLAVISAAGPAELYQNSLLPLEQFRAGLLKAYQGFLAENQFSEAVRLAEAMSPLLLPENALQLQAEAHGIWGKHLRSQAARTSGASATQLLEEARTQYRAAGEAHRRLAEMRFATNDYAENVWSSAEAYLEGRDYLHASQQLQEYLKYELRRRRPRALLDLGDAQLSLGMPTLALVTLQECIDNYPRDPSSYRARLLAAKAHVEQGNLAAAKKLLLANLEGELTPASIEWRDSLFALGLLLHDEGQLLEARGRRERADNVATAEATLQAAQEIYNESIRRLEEAVTRYPDVPQLVESRYVIAEAYRAAASFPREKLQQAKIETARIEHSKEMQHLLQSAIREYEHVQELLTQRREDSQLSPNEQSILRNCYFARGTAYFELKQYEEAISAYSAATNRYQNEPEVLDAFLQLVACYRNLNKEEEARSIVEQAKVVLGRINATDEEFKKTTVHTRAEWARVLDYLVAL
ncbi:MAG: tetratricopeptide repeat protein [Planctomycetota bacterium]|nr:tetratricopeptide repeat protein [Planctomycetota bacterium]